MNYNLSLVFISMLLLFLFGCKMSKEQSVANTDSISSTDQEYVQAYKNLPQNDAGNLVRKSIDAAGGWDTWLQKSSMSFVKNITHYDTDGNEKSTQSQLHQYQLFPSFKARISWEENGDEHVILNNGKQSWRLKNGTIQTDEALVNSAYNSSFGSHYVICMPFKLADPGTVLGYDGPVQLPTEKEALSVDVKYQEGAGSAALYHTWKYYFHPEKPELIANFLDYGDGFTYTEYLEFDTIGDITFNLERMSYRTDKNLEKLEPKTRYKNTEISFGPPLASSLFEP